MGFPSTALFQIENRTISDFSTVLDALDREGFGFRDERVQTALQSCTQKMRAAKAKSYGSTSVPPLGEVMLEGLELYVVAKLDEWRRSGELAVLRLSATQADAIDTMAYWLAQTIPD